MYTYESFEKFGVFTLLRPVFVTLLIAAVILFLILIIPKARSKFLNGFSVISLSLLSIFVSAQVLFYGGIVVDELGLGGDAVATYMFLAIVVFSLLNPLLYFGRFRN
ncbi:hypothetical protein DCC39_08355 [Pueribacillus theae]|uniref:Uncharacterized protein n=1 Tax=Pueribacillus theae TaxID=2171751 RepID=A0A2U1K4R2_9BACI|nr:hypothetical protein [Pueribacillus theae]PWA11938.1 hypothetical protein DCC39_08355 [Pueribacillus theae]